MPQKDYETDGLTVHWDSSRCIHTAICLNALPAVFDVNRRPWIDIDAAPAAEVARAVVECPTGALSFSSATIGQELPAETQLRPIRSGPMIVQGDVELVDDEGNVQRETSVALCRCGNSGNQPFCDNSHRTSGFQEPEFRARTAVEAPDEVCEPQPGFATE